MQGERDKGEGDKASEEAEKNPVGQDSPKNEYGEIGEPAQPGAGSAPPRSMGTHGSEFGQFGDHDDRGQQGQSGTGQADLGSQAGSTLAGHGDQQDLGELGGEVDQPGSFAGGVSGRQKPTEGEGFILQEDTEQQDFARDGQGAIENSEPAASDVERETDRDEKGDSNIEGGVG
jgi:hypothetical protein